MRRSVLSALLLALTLVALPAAQADALTYGTGLSLVGQDIGQQRCFYASATAIKPAANGMNVDFKAFIHKKVRSASYGCSTAYSSSLFFSGESAVRAILYRTSTLDICSATGYTNTPGTVSSWGIGKTWNKSGGCASTTYFLVAADGAYSNALANFFEGPYTASFTL